MDTEILKEIGMTNAEIKIYISLLELGISTAGPILEKTGLQNSVVHITLHNLVKKGFVTFIKKGKVKHYRATDPQNINKMIDEKKKRLELFIPNLIGIQNKQERQDAEVFEGFQGFKNMHYEFIKGGKKGDEYLYFSFYTENLNDFEEVYNFYKEFSKERVRRGFNVKGIVPIQVKPKYKDRDKTNVLFIDFPAPMNISIFNDKVFFTPWEDKKVSYLIHSRQLSQSFRQYFYSIWNKYRKK